MFFAWASMVPASSSASLYSSSGSREDALDCGREVGPLRLWGRLRDPLSESTGEPSLDLVFFETVLPLDDRDAKNESSSIVDIVVAAVAVELDRCEDFMLSSVVDCVYIEERLVADLERLRFPLIDPAKKSLIDPGRVLNKFLEIASRPNIATFERAVGVEGIEFPPVLNWKSPNWWTNT
jgi:hypothetical protein